MHDQLVEPIVLDGKFRVLGYGLGHSTLIMDSGHAEVGAETVRVEFTGVLAVKLRGSYRGLTLRAADEPTRTRLLDFTDLRSHPRWDVRSGHLCLTLPTEDDGFVVCGGVRVIAGRRPPGMPGRGELEDVTVLHGVHGGPLREL